MNDEFSAGAAMRFSMVDPHLVREIMAFWRQGDDRDYATGFIMRLPEDYPLGQYAYIVLTVQASINKEGVTTQYFKTLPVHLYERAVDWINGGPILAAINQSLGYAKAHAKHGSSSSIGLPADPR